MTTDKQIELVPAGTLEHGDVVRFNQADGITMRRVVDLEPDTWTMEEAGDDAEPVNVVHVRFHDGLERIFTVETTVWRVNVDTVAEQTISDERIARLIEGELT